MSGELLLFALHADKRRRRREAPEVVEPRRDAQCAPLKPCAWFVPCPRCSAQILLPIADVVEESPGRYEARGGSRFVVCAACTLEDIEVAPATVSEEAIEP